MPKIEVTADVSHAQREVGKLTQSAQRQRSTGSDGELRRQQALERAMARQRQEVERTAKAYRELGRNVSEFQAKAANKAFHRMQGNRNSYSPYLSGLDLGDIISGSGAFTSRFASQPESQRVRQRIIENVGQRTGMSTGGRNAPNFIEQRAGRMGAVVGTGLGAMVTGFSTGGAMGSLGTLGGGAIGGALGGMFGPAGSLFGGAIGSALGGTVGGKLDASVQDSIAAATSASTLRATLGQVANGFEDVHEAARRAGHGLGITSTEVQRLGTTFAKTAGSKGFGDVSESVRDAAGYARGFGLNDEFSTRFFAQLRQTKVSQTPEDSRRMGGVIAEGIVKGGGVAKTEEFMGAVSQYMSAQLQQSSAAPDVEGFATLLSRLSGKGGIDTGTAGSLIGTADAGVRQHGDLATEAYKLGTAKRLYGNDFSGLDLKSLEQGGFFSSVEKSLGKGSAMHKLAESIGDKDYMARVSKYGNGSSAFGLGLVEDAIKQSRGNVQIAAESVGRVTGLNQDQAATLALAARDPQALGTMKGLGPMNMRNMASAAQVLTGKDEDLRKMALDFSRGDGIKNPMSGTNASQLADIARTGSGDQLRTALLNTLKHVEVTDLGQNVAATTADIKEVTMSITDKLIPAVEGVKETILWAAGRDKADFEKFINAPKQRAYESELSRLEKMRSKTSASGYAGELDADIAKQQETVNRLKKDAEAEALAKKAVEPSSLATFDMNAPTTAATEAPYSNEGRSLKGPRNERNNNPGNLKYGDFARRHGATGADSGGFAIFPDKAAGSRAMDALLGRYSKDGLDTVGGVIGKWAPPSENDTAGYAATVAKRLGVGVNQRMDMSDPAVVANLAKQIAAFEGSRSAYVDPPVPAEGRRAQAESIKFDPFAITVTHQNPNGTTTGLPMPETTLLKPRMGAGNTG